MARWSSIITHIQTKTNRIQQKTLIIRIIEMGLLTGVWVSIAKILIIKEKTSAFASILPSKMGKKWRSRVLCGVFFSKFSAIF